MSFSGWKESELGKIPVEWEVVKIDEIADVISGGTPSTKKSEYYGDEIAWITPKDLSGYTSKYISRGERSITNLGLENSSAKLLPPNTVLFSSRAPIGYVAISRDQLTTNQGFKNLVCDSTKADFEFMYYKMKTLKEALESVAGGSTFKEVSGKVVKEFNIVLPTLPEQKAIANILSSLDEKIELNNQMNKTLEEMAQALFKRWFVDFEFPNEDGEPYKSSGGEMVDSELGMIPKGWKVGELATLVKEIVTGKTPSTKIKENYGDAYPFITIPDMHNKVFVTRAERYLSEQGNQLQVKKLLPKNSIIVSCIATVGLVAINAYPSHTNQQINSVIPKNDIDLYYFYEYLKLKEDELKAIGSAGSTTLNVNKGQFEKIKYIYAHKAIREKYMEQVKSMYDMICTNQIENEKLIEVRDTLLPKLMSGEIRVTDLQN